MNKIEIEGSYIQYAGGYDKENIVESDFLKALKDLEQMDDEHGAFWIGVYGAETDEFVLELHKSLTLFGNFSENENYKIQLKSLEASKEYFNLLLSGMIEKLKEKLKTMHNNV
ncbi:hypothetical protein A9Q93_02925 [Nonlabens dokdonensis]|uniref:Uncharacterized protein n=1 Tax=Nonlabens dokdonensis TaxID=328515 RepID=A0A1Z8B8U6_9FLAO|nr:hypothetical protein [Nonlabens dokdonensis]OUS19025.1 hypothetical protein A9Q93_02925 [Nonlabens dokdonensis]